MQRPPSYLSLTTSPLPDHTTREDSQKCFPSSSSYHIIHSEDEVQCFIFRSALSNHILWHQYLEEIRKHKVYAFQSCDLNKIEIYLREGDVFWKENVESVNYTSNRDSSRKLCRLWASVGVGGGERTGREGGRWYPRNITGTVGVHDHGWH